MKRLFFLLLPIFLVIGCSDAVIQISRDSEPSFKNAEQDWEIFLTEIDRLSQESERLQNENFSRFPNLDCGLRMPDCTLPPEWDVIDLITEYRQFLRIYVEDSQRMIIMAQAIEVPTKEPFLSMHSDLVLVYESLAERVSEKLALYEGPESDLLVNGVGTAADLAAIGAADNTLQEETFVLMVTFGNWIEHCMESGRYTPFIDFPKAKINMNKPD